MIDEGMNITITCEATGYPPPTIVWSWSDGTLSDRVSVSDDVSIPTGNGNVTRVSVNLTIMSTSREDTGMYICSANNYIGSDSTNVNVTVQCKLILLNQARAGRRPARAWFLEITLMRTSVCVCMCVSVCPPPRLLETSGVM